MPSTTVMMENYLQFYDNLRQQWQQKLPQQQRYKCKRNAFTATISFNSSQCLPGCLCTRVYVCGISKNKSLKYACDFNARCNRVELFSHLISFSFSKCTIWNKKRNVEMCFIWMSGGRQVGFLFLLNNEKVKYWCKRSEMKCEWEQSSRQQSFINSFTQMLLLYFVVDAVADDSVCIQLC